jgi:hypothetical protein
MKPGRYIRVHQNRADIEMYIIGTAEHYRETVVDSNRHPRRCVAAKLRIPGYRDRTQRKYEKQIER